MNFWVIFRLVLNLIGGGGGVMIGLSLVSKPEGSTVRKLLGFHLLGSGVYNLSTAVLFLISHQYHFNQEQLLGFGPYYTIANSLEVIPVIVIILYLLGILRFNERGFKWKK